MERQGLLDPNIWQWQCFCIAHCCDVGYGVRHAHDHIWTGTTRAVHQGGGNSHGGLEITICEGRLPSSITCGTVSSYCVGTALLKGSKICSKCPATSQSQVPLLPTTGDQALVRNRPIYLKHFTYLTVIYMLHMHLTHQNVLNTLGLVVLQVGDHWYTSFYPHARFDQLTHQAVSNAPNVQCSLSITLRD